MVKYAEKAFKAYDIRGIVETELTPEMVTNLGKVLGSMALEAGAKSLVVARDGRLSSLHLSKSLIGGILASGCDVFDIGEVPTPLMYFATYQLKTGSGVMITGSHNPPEYNGFKMMIGGYTVYGDQIQGILQRLTNNDFIDEQHGICQGIDVVESYIGKIVEDVKLSGNISIVIDCGNGVAGAIAPKLYRRMGAKVLGLFCDVDGNFPNHHPDPSKPHNLKDLITAVKNSDAVVGFAFDGDGDRLGIVAKDGNIIYPDRQMMLFAADVLENNLGGKVIYDVKSTSLLKGWIEENGGVPLLCRTGHSFIKAKIKETGAVLAGEMSGHFFFNDRWFGFDDGIYAGARMLEVLSKLEDPTALLNALPNRISTPEINIDVDNGNPHAIIDQLPSNINLDGVLEVVTVDGIRVEYTDGFGLVRASNTTPVLVLRFEAETVASLNRIKKCFYDLLLPYVDKKLLEVLM